MYPLSYHQERLWFIDQFEKGNVYPTPPIYHNLPLVLSGRGRPDSARLAAAWQALAARHSALRTRIVAAEGGARQEVAPAITLPWTERALGEVTPESALAAALAEAKRPFYLERDPLARAALLRFDPDAFLLVLTFHHLICDRPSLRFLAEEFAALAREGGSALPEPELSYSDYSEWQRTLPDDALEPLAFYWKWQLRGHLAALEFPSARPRPAVHTFTEARATVSWSPAQAAALRTLAASAGSEPAAVALAAFQVLLHRYARQEEIVVGTSFPNRRQPGTERLVGPVANLVVLRGQLGGNPEFGALLAEITRTWREAREHQEMPFDALVRLLNPDKDMSRTALFDVLFTYDEAPWPALDWGNGPVQVIDPFLGVGKYDLALGLQATPAGGLEGTLVYNADFHDAWFIEQWLRHYPRLVAALARDPAQRIDTVELLDATERHRLLEEDNATAAAAPREQTLCSLLAAQVVRTPTRVALSCGEESWTYADLDARANRLAHLLRAQGVGPETLVAVCLERSADLVATLLAVLKAGGAYLPLDPAYPRERLAFTVRDAQVQHLVTVTDLRDVLTEPVAHVICLDTAVDDLAAQPATPPTVAIRPENLAYCLYTSGSTGQPKGVLIEHRQVVRLLFNDRLPFSFGPSDVWTLFHSCCFDFSVWEMYGALLYGGRLVAVPRAVAPDPEAWAALVVREGVTVLNQTPTAFASLAREVLRTRAPLALRYVVFGGEALLPLALRDFQAAYPAVKLVNMYGITETTVHVTFTEVTDADIRENCSAIGRPLPTTTVYLFDEHGQLVPPGVPGEIYVGGEGVGRGYLRREELTRERFVANPYRPAERLYRSGDLAKRLPDGRLVYLGRIDDQVQIRGFRVELGEIKTRLLRHPTVSAVEVLARTLDTDHLELVAYVVPKEAGSAAIWRRHLQETLPDYMVPSVFVELAALPLTANGKVDRRALPEPRAGAADPAASSIAPRTPTEQTLAALFAAVLRQERVGANESFFELGGHSLLATQLMSRVRETWGVELPLRHVFATPTVSGLAAVIDEHRSAGAPPASTPISRTARRPRALVATS